MSISRCRKPLLSLCGDVSRITIALGECPPCPPEVISLRIEQDGCPEYRDVCVEEVITLRCFCDTVVEDTVTKIVREEIPKRGVTYPLHEIDPKGNAVFVLDSKLKELGTGRYSGIVDLGDCGCYTFDLDYKCGTFNPVGISATTMEGC